MRDKISGAFKKIYTDCFRSSTPGKRKCQTQGVQSPHYCAIKLATLKITPTRRLLSFRVSKNYLYLSFAKQGADLVEFNELCAEEL
ncbi:hypothetical protein K1T71_001629 [Dendrolimus kikuchii]|uniref:Uncharacterized protein n=1 Tax=Dendrolimus kikuchii TaxID=765133 RepID=A0ACC1DEN7_9NEOP|nr:hypothetical protein K1T71_001629 [Dendrolimus kikuchii]